MGRIDAIKREKEQNASGRSGEFYLDTARLKEEWGVEQWKPEEGDNFIAIIPPEDPDCYFGVKISPHFDVGPKNGAFLCPAEHRKQRCVI